MVARKRTYSRVVRTSASLSLTTTSRTGMVVFPSWPALPAGSSCASSSDPSSESFSDFAGMFSLLPHLLDAVPTTWPKAFPPRSVDTWPGAGTFVISRIRSGCNGSRVFLDTNWRWLRSVRIAHGEQRPHRSCWNQIHVAVERKSEAVLLIFPTVSWT